MPLQVNAVEVWHSCAVAASSHLCVLAHICAEGLQLRALRGGTTLAGLRTV